MSCRCLLLLLSCLCAAWLPAQDAAMTRFITEFEQSLGVNDEKAIDKAIKAAPDKALQYFQDLRVELWRGKTAVAAKVAALKASWPRVYEKSGTLERIERWIESQDQDSYNAFLKQRDNVYKAWQLAEAAFKDKAKKPYLEAIEAMTGVARNLEQTGHKLAAAEAWGLVVTATSRMPDKTIEEREVGLAAQELFLSLREAWEWTHDPTFTTIKQYVKTEKEAIERDRKAGDKRRAEGYDSDAKGIDGLLMPGAKDDLHPMVFDALESWENDLDYGPKGGPLPVYWWMAQAKAPSADKDSPEHVQLSWFRRQTVFLVRLAANKYAISLKPGDPKLSWEIEVGNKGKPTQFWLDTDKKVPYAMFFWTGGDKERVGDVDVNMTPQQTLANVYYRSAASWTVSVGPDALTFYDDNANGLPCDADPFAGELKVGTLGDHDGDGNIVPLLDSMRVGKGPRVPYSEFVKLTNGWYHLRRSKDAEVALRPFNPEYLKTGKVKLVWNGPKPTAPVQLVIRGRGDLQTAMFDVASGKEVEVPAGEYTVIYGRLLTDRGAKTKTATLYGGDSQSFVVEAGKVHELKMGAPFQLVFERRGDQDVSIDALKIRVREAHGCVLTEQHGMGTITEVLAAKHEDGKGAKAVGKFVPFADPELLNKAAGKYAKVGLLAACFPMPEGYKDGELVLKVKLPAAGMKVALRMPKHPLFGVVNSAFQ